MFLASTSEKSLVCGQCLMVEKFMLQYWNGTLGQIWQHSKYYDDVLNNSCWQMSGMLRKLDILDSWHWTKGSWKG